MLELLGTLEVDLQGEILKVRTLISSGEFDNKDNKDFIQNILYILQDVNSIKSKLSNTGNFLKIRIRCERTHYEVAVGSSYIKINKYKPE